MVAGHDRIAQELARDYLKSHGRTAGDVVTREVISVADTTELADVAILLETKRIKRVSVLRNGKLVGIVSRANLVRALAATKSDPAIDADNDDRTIRDKLLAELMGQEWFQAKEWFKIWAADIIGSRRPFLVLRRPLRRGKTGVAHCRREHRSGSARRRAHRPIVIANPPRGTAAPGRPSQSSYSVAR
jgi:CBS domain-containing protein